MHSVMVKSKQHCRSHESSLNFRTTYAMVTNAIPKLITPVSKTCEPIRHTASHLPKYNKTAFTRIEEQYPGLQIFFTLLFLIM